MLRCGNGRPFGPFPVDIRPVLCEDGQQMLHDRLQRARLSLLGLSLGDALGSQFFVPGNRHHLASRSIPPGPWQWTDDTEMAGSVYLVLAVHNGIEQDALAASFARRHDFDRGYGPVRDRSSTWSWSMSRRGRSATASHRRVTC